MIPRALLAAMVVTGCSAEDTLEDGFGFEAEEDAGVEFRGALPSGYAPYCSVRWPNGDWDVSYGGTDPCAYLDANAPPGFTIERAGRYAYQGMNNVVMRCAEVVWWGRSWDANVLGMGKGYAQENGLTHCIMTVAPANLPVFDAPFSSRTVVGGNGFDFARVGELDVAQFGQPSALTNLVDWKGRDRAGEWADNHNGIDYAMPVGTPIYAVADGTVVASHARKVSQCNRTCGAYQEEIIITHEFSAEGLPGDRYAESFSSYYAHLDSRLVDEGDTVGRGDLIGYSGNTGCSSSPHLHFGVKRLSNTASELFDADYTAVDANPVGCPREDNSPAAIDPYGWWPSQIGFDPWGWSYHDKGAMSINLWREGQVPRRE